MPAELVALFLYPKYRWFHYNPFLHLQNSERQTPVGIVTPGARKDIEIGSASWALFDIGIEIGSWRDGAKCHAQGVFRQRQRAGGRGGGWQCKGTYRERFVSDSFIDSRF